MQREGKLEERDRRSEERRRDRRERGGARRRRERGVPDLKSTLPPVSTNDSRVTGARKVTAPVPETVFVPVDM